MNRVRKFFVWMVVSAAWIRVTRNAMRHEPRDRRVCLEEG
jgi:hypothetical protein